MSYSMIVIGELIISEQFEEAFLKSVITVDGRDDYIGNLCLHDYARSIATVADVINVIPQYTNNELLIHFDGGKLNLEGVLTEDNFNDYAVYLVEVFRESISMDGIGELAFLEEQTIFVEQEPEYCFLVSVNKKDGFCIQYMDERVQRKYRKTLLFKTIAQQVFGVDKESMEFRRLPKN